MFCGSLSPLSPLRAVIMAFLTSRIASPLEKLAGMVREDGSDVTPESLASFNAWYYEAYWLKDAVQEKRRAVARVAALNDEAMTVLSLDYTTAAGLTC